MIKIVYQLQHSKRKYKNYIKILSLSVRSRKENRLRPAPRNHKHIEYLDCASHYKSVGEN